MVKCRHCWSEELRKDVVVKGKQRYKRKQCKLATRKNDQRHKCSLSKRLKVLKGYLKRLECVPNPLIIKWIRVLEMHELLLCCNKSCC